MKKIKFSIIIPVYNTEKYLTRCLESVFSQSYKNYEIILINDGSNDNSEQIIEQYRNRIIYIKQENNGLSVARNNGVKYSKGDYLLFLDSDDYLDANLLNTLANFITDEDVIRFQLRTVNNDNYKDYSEKEFYNLNGSEAFKNICRYHFIDLACLYAFKRSYYNINKFQFKKGVFHEDFGLIPLIVYNASKVSSIDFIGYNYYQRDNSIMNNNDYEKTLKKVDDIFIQGLEILDKTDNEKANCLSNHVVNSMLQKLSKIERKDQKKYVEIIKKYNLLNKLNNHTFKQKIRNTYYKVKLVLCQIVLVNNKFDK